jgi:hypothetical protein
LVDWPEAFAASGKIKRQAVAVAAAMEIETPFACKVLIAH